MTLYNVTWLIALIVFLFIIILVPLKIKKVGKSENTKQKGFWTKIISIYVFAFVLLILCKFFYFGELQNLILEGCCCLGAYIASKEIWQQDSDEE